MSHLIQRRILPAAVFLLVLILLVISITAPVFAIPLSQTAGGRDLSRDDWIAHLPLAITMFLVVVVVDSAFIAKVIFDRKARARQRFRDISPNAVQPQAKPVEAPTIPALRGIASASLQATDGPARGKIFAIDRTMMTIGRSSNNNISIPDAQMSRSHTVVEFKDNGYWVKDNQSLNGTFLNKARLQAHVPQRLQDGDIVEIGESKFSVSLRVR